jgi:hypothetical protein
VILRGLTPTEFAGEYYVRAYIDSNGNNKRDVWESWGYANHYGKNEIMNNQENFDSIYTSLFNGMTAPFIAMAADVAMNTVRPHLTVFIEDTDVDQDWFPDAWEYERNPGEDFLGAIGPSADWNGDPDTEINPTLVLNGAIPGTLSMLALGSTDSDGDGIDDFKELILGTDPNAADPASVAANLALGLAPDDELTFNVSSLVLGSAGADVAWEVNVARGATGVSPAMLSLMSSSGTGDVTYYVDYTVSLDTPEWKPVQQGTVTLDGYNALVERINAELINSERGFFRVRLGN